MPKVFNLLSPRTPWRLFSLLGNKMLFLLYVLYIYSIGFMYLSM